MIQLIGHVFEFNTNFDVFNGNIKMKRLQISPDGIESFMYNGNMIVMNQSPDPKKEVYMAHKCTPQFATRPFFNAVN